MNIKKQKILKVLLIVVFIFSCMVTGKNKEVQASSGTVVAVPAGTTSNPTELGTIIHNLKAGQTLALEKGNYKISSQAYLREPNITVKGAGIDQTIISVVPQWSTWGIIISGNPGNNGANAILKDFTIKKEVSDAAVIKVYNTLNTTIQNVKTINGYYGIDLNTATNTIIDGCQITGATKAAIGVGGDSGGNSSISIKNTKTYQSGWSRDLQINDKADYGNSKVTIESGNGFFNGCLYAESSIRGSIVEQSNGLRGFVKKELGAGFAYVYVKATGIQLSESKISLEVNQSKQITATVDPEEYCDVINWSSSDESIASVDSAGRIVGHRVGTATVTAMANDQKATCEVEVTKGVEPEIPNVDTSKPVDEVIAGINDEKSKEVIDQAGSKIIEDIAKGTVDETAISSETLDKVKEALDAGKTVSVKVESETLEKAQVKETDLQKVEEATKELVNNSDNKLEVHVAQYLDLGIALQAGTDKLGNLNKIEQPITFTMAIPETLKVVGRDYYVVRIHNGVSTILNTVIHDDGTLSFETDCFSTYALVYSDKVDEIPTTPIEPSTPELPGSSSSGSNVNTGDSTSLSIWMVMMMISSVGIFYTKKYN